MTDRCGQCDHHRHVELPDGRMARCPRCHPLRREIQPAQCPQHRGEPIATCRPCAGDALTAPAAEYRPRLRLIQGDAA